MTIASMPLSLLPSQRASSTSSGSIRPDSPDMLEEPREHGARLGPVTDQVRLELLIEELEVAGLHG